MSLRAIAWQSSRRRTRQTCDIAKLWQEFLSTHQTDNLAKLWIDHLFLLELIAKIGGAVSRAINLAWLRQCA